ncbi:MAG: hypothetical protein HUK11_07100 [Muribaculaceae bacterium]|nr:hypothetical protein [Muribaculaceae bacterium]
MKKYFKTPLWLDVLVLVAGSALPRYWSHQAGEDGNLLVFTIATIIIFVIYRLIAALVCYLLK